MTDEIVADPSTKEIVNFLASQEGKDTLDAQYRTWIQDNYPTREAALGRCSEATQAMVKAFPWLVRARGIAHSLGNEHPHWWCKCPFLEQIIDPTEKQFGMIMYWEELPDDDPRCMYPRRKCMNCGSEYYEPDDKFGCSTKCLDELMKDFGC